MSALAIDSTEVIERFALRGMTCGSCVRHVEAALAAVPGVRSAQVDLAAATATVQRDPAASSFEVLQKAVAEAGYGLETWAPAAARARLPLKPIVFGLLAALGLLAFYLGIITLLQGWEHALGQLSLDRWFVGPIVTGFGSQIGLFTYMRGLHGRAVTGGVVAGTGTSTAAMLACCAHHLTDVLPILGLSGAVIFLNAYKTPLLGFGIVMNLAGVAYMLYQIRRQRWIACHRLA